MPHIKQKRQKTEGFALIVAISLMAFILMLILSLTTLVRIELNSGVHAKEQLQAQQNALLGLHMALGNLQKYAGDDQRVSAAAAIDDQVPLENGNWTVVYDSRSPNAADSPVFLVSGFPGQVDAARKYQTPVDGDGRSTSKTDVLLVGSGSVDVSKDIDNNGKPDDVVVVPKVLIDDAEDRTVGRYAWWVGDEGIKARINLPEPEAPSTDTPAKWQAMAAGQVADLRMIDGMQDIPVNDSRLPFVSELSDLALLDSNVANVSPGYFHSLTGYSSGLFTNVRDGGFKKDLSLAFEMDDAEFNSSAFFAGQENIPYADHQAAYVFSVEGDDYVVHGPTWHLLRNYYRQYKDLNFSSLGLPSIGSRGYLPLPTNYSSDKSTSSLLNLGYSYTEDPLGKDTEEAVIGTPLLRATDAALSPIVTNVQYLYSIRVRPVDSALDVLPAGSDHTHAVDVIWDPVVTLWNPYNVSLEFLGIKVRMATGKYTYPLQFAFHTKDPVEIRGLGTGTDFDKVRLEHLTDSSVSNWFTGQGQSFIIGNGGDVDTLAPGELRVYSLGNSSPVMYSEIDYGNTGSDSGNEHGIEALEGWNYQGGVAIPTGITGKMDQEFSLRIMDLYWMSVSGYLITDWDKRWNSSKSDSSQPRLWSYKFYDKLVPSSWEPQDWVDAPIGGGKFLFADIGTKRPFARFDCYLMPNSDVDALAMPGHVNPRGQTSAFPFPKRRVHTGNASGWKRELEPLSALPGAVAIGPDNHGYWGPDNASGESFVTLYEVPTAPLSSIGQLMHANVGLRGGDAMHPVGNSFASPMIARDSLMGAVEHDRGDNGTFYDVYYPDYSYLLNRELWDGYFFSTLCDQEVDVFDEEKSLEEQLPGLLSGTETLLNPQVRLHTNDGEGLNQIQARLLDNDGKLRADAYDWSAANLMNDGAFNVNSTSVDAWAVVLGGLRDSVIHYLDGPEVTLSTDDEAGAPFGKFTLPNGSSLDAWRGFSRLSDAQIRALAGNIVEQVKARGPFLSLGDFVNRSLATDETGLAGPLQAAIWATELDAEDPVNTHPDFSVESGINTRLDYLDWTNLETSDGNMQKLANGMPGYLTQGDLLLALGSMLTVRSDTFRIRAYGESLDISMNTLAEAWLEVIVQRVPGAVEPSGSDPTQLDYFKPQRPGDGYGRRYKIISLRWLSSDEV
ncbi:hypothetical protein [Cerasicoccus fimbriatus]|uniref:hypothetical protein n=1 Tax=Cerasicoccus fimbriatus TaxID=3014554 RepID=UPI0022B4022F|nr:hypothetical protein [Cerasicoccus sp. TK19100]